MRRAKHGGRVSRFAAGMIALVVVAVATYFAFAKDIPFTKPYEVSAVFQNTSAIQTNSPVRIAGVEVGKVAKVKPAGDGSTASVVTMKLKKNALPIHADAQAKIRPRIFLEGNFFVDIRPGTPGSPDLKNGSTIPATQTSAPVQLDQVLGTLKTSARRDLQTLLQGYGSAIGGQPTAAEDATQDPATRGQTAGASLNDSLADTPDALRGTAIVNDALLGSDPGDLRKLIRGTQKVSAALAGRETNLKDLITNFNTTTGALADEQTSLRSTIRLLPQVLDAADPALDNLNKAFPPTRAFAREILPGVRETPATISASLPWIAQVRALVRPAELQGLVGDLKPAVRDLATFTDGTVRFLPQADLVNRCLLSNVLPTGDVVIQDGAQTTGIKNYKEFFQALVGLSGESQNFDGNGQYTRFQPGGGDQTVSTGTIGANGPKLFANTLRQPLGTKPARPATRPPYRGSATCYKNTPPNLNGAATGWWTVKKAISKHLRDFVAILFVAVVGLGVAGYILSNQRFYLPNWVPVVGSDFYNVEADLGTAQAVVPGQGQSVNIAGVKIGDIGKVRLVDGHARVEMKIRRKYRSMIYRDANILLRPKTGLKDMYLELDPGNPSAGRMPEDGRIPVANTLPDVNPDEVLASLDQDTRAYLRVLLSSGAQALDGDSPANLRATLKRLEPTGRDAKKITTAVAQRRRNVERVIHNFQEISTQLASRDRQLAGFVDSSNANFSAIANQDQNLRAALRLFPGTLSETRDTLTKVDSLAKELGPAFSRLRPAARALGPSLRDTRPFLRSTTPVVKSELRPFARDTRPAVRELRSTARSLSPVTPRLTNTFTVLNKLLNTLTYNPPGSEEGYLFWASWVNHAGATLFGTQDAHGPVRRGLVFLSCSTGQVLDSLKVANPQLGTLVELLNAPKTSEICPKAVP